MKTILPLLIASILALPTQAQEEDSFTFLARAAVISAKACGGGGIIRQMALFQESTQMAGGHEFLVRFYQTEAARLGTTAQGLSESQNKACQTMDAFLELLDSIEAEITK